MTIETKELVISEELKRKVEMICRFAYVKPHILKVKNNDYLIFEEYDEIFINGYTNKIKFKDLEEYIKANQNLDKSRIKVYSIELIKASSIAF